MSVCVLTSLFLGGVSLSDGPQDDAGGPALAVSRVKDDGESFTGLETAYDKRRRGLGVIALKEKSIFNTLFKC